MHFALSPIIALAVTASTGVFLYFSIFLIVISNVDDDSDVGSCSQKALAAMTGRDDHIGDAIEKDSWEFWLVASIACLFVVSNVDFILHVKEYYVDVGLS